MLYRETASLETELFQNPTSEYRGAPFWAWNCKMTKEHIIHTLDELQKMGMGGGHIHCRTGMGNEYLGEEFMDLVSYTNEESKKRGMLTWLYDEDRWPSGAGGGFVTKEQKYRIRFLVFSPTCLDGINASSSQLSSSGQAVRSNNRTFLSRYAVKIQNGYLTDYKCLTKDAVFEEEYKKDGYKEWFAYLEVSGDNPWFNNEAYLNTLDKAAVERFVEVTHERYFEKLGDEFDHSIPGIFTDEPQFSFKGRLGFAEEEKEITIPFTDDLEDSFYKTYGHSLLNGLPELFWELGKDRFSVIRYQYHDHICERFAEAFADTIGDWCKAHHILLTGHMMEEPTLESQTAALGEAMRSYRSFTLPGIDMLCDRRELSTAKQAQSAARQYGRQGVISELYGVTNWDFDFRGHKLQGDWQAALGVVVRVPHLTWTSMAGEAKRDYPAAIGYQSPWYEEYHYVEDYFARLNTVLTRGKAVVKVGVIHPIESYWMYWGPEEQTGAIRQEMDEKFKDLIDWLLFGLVDFDFLSESLLPELAKENDKKEIGIQNKCLKVGDMEYETILVPDCITIRESTMEILEKFSQAGGNVIFMGEVPKLVQVIPSERPQKLARTCTCIPYNCYSLMKSLESERELDIRSADGNRTDNLVYQLREEHDKRWLFLAHVRKMENPDIPCMEKLTITIKGEWKATVYDAVGGAIKECPGCVKEGKTILRQDMYEHDSLLLLLEPAKESLLTKKQETKGPLNESTIELPIELPITLCEPNVCILDMAQYSFDDEPWQKREEILRIDNRFREKLGYPLRMEAFAQPWLNQQEEPYEHVLNLKFIIESELDIDKAALALEDAEDTQIYVNGTKMKGIINGWFCDRDIHTAELSGLKKGSNELLIKIPYNLKRNVEAMYLLGDFGVKVSGSKAVLTEPVRTMTFGDMSVQGLPFYGGNVTYSMDIEIKDAKTELVLEASMFRAPLLKVSIDGEEKGRIAYSPYRVSLGTVSKGKHQILLTVFGNRINTFGTLHNCNRTEDWIGPNAWRTEGTSWAEEYQLHQTGLLKAPVMTAKK